MLFAEIDADGWVRIIGAVFGGLALVAIPVLKLLLDLRRDLKENTDATNKASKRAGVAAEVGVETNSMAQEIKTLVNGERDKMQADLAAAKAESAGLRLEIAALKRTT